MKPFGRQISMEPECTKQPGLRKGMIDDMNAFHGFITPGGKMSTQRLEDECSTALPSMCTTGSLESLPTTPAGWGALMPPPEAAPVQGWQPGAQIWGLGAGLGAFDGLPSLHSAQQHREMPSDLDIGDFTTFLDPGLDLPDVQLQRSMTELSEALSTLESEAVEQATPASTPRKVEQATPPPTPRKEHAADKTCPLAPGNVQQVPMLLKALSKNRLNLVKNALESDPQSASFPFWDHDAEPPLCAAVRLGCGVDIVELLLDSGADVASKNFAGQNPLDLLYSEPWRTVVSSNEIEYLLLSRGANPSENTVKLPREEEANQNDMLRWDAFADAQTLNDFGLPPSLGSFGFFDIEPPPTVKSMA